MDLMVDAGYLADDSAFHVPDLYLQFGGVEAKNPRVEIKIEPSP